MVDDLDVESPAVDETEADPPLVVDANAPLASSVALERLDARPAWASSREALDPIPS
jgi:hypothetical protein